jgi:MFS family permease
VDGDRPSRDVVLLFATRSLRMFGYGFLAVVLVLYLGAIGFDGAEVGLLLGLTLLGDAAISLLLTTRADRFGRRRTLFLGSLLMVGAGIVFAGSTAFPVLLVAATLGVLSPSGNEVGPFLAIEQASLSQLVDARGRTSLFARYQVVGSVATACGSLAAGVVTQAALDAGFAPADSFRVVIIGYAIVGVAMAFVFPLLSRAVEVPAAATARASPARRPAWACTSRGDRGPAVGAVRARRVRRRVRHPGVHRLLADRAVRGDPRRCDPARPTSPRCRRVAAALAAVPDPDGSHLRRHAADPGAVHADARAVAR